MGTTAERTSDTNRSLAQSFAYDPRDDEERRRQKGAIFVVAGACSSCGVL